MAVHLQTLNFLRGLQDTATEDGLGFPGWSKFYDCRVSEGGAKRRKGVVRIGRAGKGKIKALDFDGSTDYITIPLDSRITTQMGTQFSIEGLVAPDVITGTKPTFYWGATTPSFVIDTDSSKLRVRVWDSAATLTTLTSTSNLPTSTVSFQVVRDGADLTLRMDNVSEDTGTMDADNLLRTPAGDVRIGYDGTNYFDGDMDYLRILGVAKSDHNDDRIRLPDPRAPYVLYDADFLLTGDSHLIDRSRFGNTGLASGTPASTAFLCNETLPVSVIHQSATRSGEKRLICVGGKRIYAGSI